MALRASFTLVAVLYIASQNFIISKHHEIRYDKGPVDGTTPQSRMHPDCGVFFVIIDHFIIILL